MTKTDILIQKDQEIKRLNDQILNLNERINNLNISIGSKDEVLKSKVKELERELELAKDQQKVIIQSNTSSKGYKCSVCGYTTPAFRNYCPSCDRSNTLVKLDSAPIYKNLDDVQKDIQKDLEKKFKKSVADLENTQLDLEIKIETLEKQVERSSKAHAADKEEWEEKTRKRYNKIIDAHREEIETLKETLQKVRKNKTDEELEAKRKAEVEELKAANIKLAEKLAEAEKVGFLRRLINKMFGMDARKQAIKEILEATELAKKLEDTKNVTYNRNGEYYNTAYTDYSGHRYNIYTATNW